MLTCLVELVGVGTCKTDGTLPRRFPSDGDANLTDFNLTGGGGGTFGAVCFLFGLGLDKEGDGRLVLWVLEAGSVVDAGGRRRVDLLDDDRGMDSSYGRGVSWDR